MKLTMSWARIWRLTRRPGFSVRPKPRRSGAKQANVVESAAPRAAHSVLFRRADLLLRELSQARADHSFEAAFRKYLAPDLLVMDDFGLHRLTQRQSEDLYALIIKRHRRSSFIVTSNRDVSEWVGLFADPILANSALDRLANGAHQLVIEGPSYRAKLAPRPPSEMPMS